MKTYLFLFLAAPMLLVGTEGFALQGDFIKKEEVEAAEPIQEGWTPRLRFSLTADLSSNNQVIGQVDGDNVTVGGKIDSSYSYRRASNEWRNLLTYRGSTTQTAALPRYVKTADTLKFDSLYLYSFESFPRLGPYIRFTAETTLFPGEDIRPTPVTYNNQTTGESFANREVFPLTDAFNPLTTKEAIGAFYKIIDRQKTKLETRVGFGALQVSVAGRNQLQVVNYDAQTSVVNLQVLESYDQVGVDYGFSFTGQWDDRSFYSLTADFLTPIGVSITDSTKECYDCSDLELTNIDLAAAASTKISDWATVSYEYKLMRQPQLFDAYQVHHGLVLSVVYDVF